MKKKRQEKRKKTKSEIILLVVFVLLIIIVGILSVLLVTKKENKNDNIINIAISGKKTISKKVNISNLKETEIREYELVIKNKENKDLNYNIKFGLKNSDNYIIKVFKKGEKESLLNNQMRITNQEIDSNKKDMKYIIIIRKIDNKPNSKYLNISINK